MTDRLSSSIDIDLIRRVLAYCPETGRFTWLVQRGTKRPGSAAGSNLDSYHAVTVAGTTFRSHRLAVLFMTGCFPDRHMDVDHRDGNKRNNAWVNLRVVTRTVNTQNLQRAHKSNRSGLLGAHWNSQESKWQSHIKINGVNVYLGRFDTAQKAHEAYMTQKRKHHVGCTI